MSAATLAELQNTLAEIYDLPATPDVRDFLLTDRAQLAGRFRRGAFHCDEQLLLAEDGRHAVHGAVHRRRKCCAGWRTTIPGRAHARKSRRLPDRRRRREPFRLRRVEYGFDKPVTLLELELQAEVDKYVLCAWLLSAQNAGRFPARIASRPVRTHAGSIPWRPRAARACIALASALRRAVLPAHGLAARSRAAGRHARRARGVAPVLPVGKRAQARAHRKVRVSCWRRIRPCRTSLDVAIVLRASLVELALQLDPLAELAQIALASRLLRFRNEAPSADPRIRIEALERTRSTDSLAFSPRAGVGSMVNGARSRGTPA